MITKVAIACQGGGSHTAFTAGALKRIIIEQDKNFEIVAFTGTSGGAMCALLSWYGLLKDGKEKGKQEAIRLLDSFWEDLSTDLPWDLMTMNRWGVLASESPFIIKESPYSAPWSYIAERTQDYLRMCLEKYVDFNEIKVLEKYKQSPELLVGAVNAMTGYFEVFKNTSADISVDAVLASAAETNFLKGVKIGDNVYWDGLFSQNPPVYNLLEGKNADEKPDEIWVIQINPQERHFQLESPSAIEDRRNELAGNISLNHEIYLIGEINKIIEDLPKKSKYAKKYKQIRVRWIRLTKEKLDVASKWNLDPQFVHDMMDSGWKEANRQLLSKL